MRNILGVLILILSTIGIAYGDCTQAEKGALEALDKSWAAANEKGDRAALNNILADDYMALPGMVGKTATIDSSMANFEREKTSTEPRDDVSYDRYSISCAGDTATMIHRSIIKTMNGRGGAPETLWFRSVHVFQKRGGKWQVVSTTGNAMDDTMTVAYLEQDWNDANLRRDKAWFEEHFAPDYVSLSSMTGKLAGKSEDIKETVEDKSTVEMTETTQLGVNVDGNVATATGMYHWKGKDEKGAPYDHKIRFIDTWIKRNGKWQVLSTAGSEIREPK